MAAWPLGGSKLVQFLLFLDQSTPADVMRDCSCFQLCFTINDISEVANRNGAIVF